MHYNSIFITSAFSSKNERLNNNTNSLILFHIDVHQSQDNPNRFFFYEVYKDADAVAFHKEQPHFALWTNFKESGGVVSSISHKLDGIFMS